MTAEEEQFGADGIWGKYVTPVIEEIVDPSVVGWSDAAFRKYNDLTIAEFLRKRGVSADAIALVMLGYDAYFGDTFQFLRDIALHHRQKGEFSIKGGDRLPKAFAAKLSDRILYGCPVARIEHDAKQVRITFLQSGAAQSVAVDRLVCAVPLMLLRRIEIAPKFSPEKLQAIERMPIFQFRAFFCNRENDSGSNKANSGGGTGFAASFKRFVDEQVTIIILSNADQEGLLIGEMTNEIAAFYFPQGK